MKTNTFLFSPMTDQYSDKLATPHYFGVSKGDGNNGVCQVFPSYIVKTDDPWLLAEKALKAEHKPEAEDWLGDNVYYEGEVFEDENGQLSGTISAVILEYPESQEARDTNNWGYYCAEFILDVFPVSKDISQYRCPKYDSIEDALD